MSTSNSESESKELPRSGEEDGRTENGHSYEENGNMTENGTSASWHASSRGGKSLLSLAFPISRVRRLVKSEADVQWVGVEAGFLIAKASEMFLEKMVEGAYDRMQANRQGSILYPHLSSHVTTTERLEFLSGQLLSGVTTTCLLLLPKLLCLKNFAIWIYSVIVELYVTFFISLPFCAYEDSRFGCSCQCFEG